MTKHVAGRRSDPAAAAFELLPVATLVFRLCDGVVVEANEAARRLFGVDGDGAIGRTTTELGLWPDGAARDAFAREVAVRGILEGYETSLRTARDRPEPARLSGRLVEAGGERLVLLVISLSGDRAPSGDGLGAAETRYRALVEAIPAIVYVDAADGSWRTLYVNPQVERLLGVTPEEYMADPELWARRLHPEDRERTIAAYEQGRLSGHPFSLEYRMSGADGRILWLRDEVTPLLDDDGNVLCLQGISVDLTSLEEAKAAAVRTQELLYATLESTADGVLVVDANGRVLHANERFAKMWRIPPALLERGYDEELLSFVVEQLEDPQAFLAKVRELYASRGESRDTLRFTDGRVFERSSLPMLRDDAVAGRVWSFHDVTERWRADEEIRAREARYRQMFEGNSAVQLMVDAETQAIFEANPAASDFYGYPLDALRGMRITEIDLRSPQEIATTIQSVLSGEKSSCEIPHRLASGEAREVQVHATPLDVGGRLLLYMVVHDVTDQRRAEAQLREAEARFRTLVEQMPAVLYVDRPDDSFQTLYVSPQVDDILGVTQRGWIRDPHLWDRHIHPDDRERVLESYLRFLRDGVGTSIEYRWIRPDGRELWVLDRTEIVRREDGEPLVLQGVIFDITERKHAEEELRRSIDLLEKVDRDRRILLGRLVAAQEEERQRIAGDIHDDPIQKMTAVGMRLEALKRRLSGEDDRRALETLEASVEGAISRLRHLMFELHPPALDRDGLAAAVAQELHELAREGDLETSLENRLVTEPPATIRVIGYRIAQEALVNIRKHAGATKVEVLLETRGDELFVRIRDDGTGFVPEHLSAAPGHVGLTAMRERAELAGGWLRIDGTSGKGATVEFGLPIARSEADGG